MYQVPRDVGSNKASCVIAHLPTRRSQKASFAVLVVILRNSLGLELCDVILTMRSAFVRGVLETNRVSVLLFRFRSFDHRADLCTAELDTRVNGPSMLIDDIGLEDG